MLITKKTTKQFSIPGGTVGRIYPDAPDGSHTIAAVEMDGVYPDSGFSINKICTETIYLIEGQFTLTYGDTDYELHPGDVFVIEPGTKYAIRGTGKAIDCITPAWDKSQNTIIPE